MYNRPMCPMMMAMQQMPMEMQPMQMMQQMPSNAHSHMYHMTMTSTFEAEMIFFEEDEQDEIFFMEFHSEHYKKIMLHVEMVLDEMEENEEENEKLYQKQPDKKLIMKAMDNCYNHAMREIPEMSNENDETRQYGRPILRGLVGALLINELLRRRRRRRRFGQDYYPGGYGGYYGGFEPFGYDDYYYD